MRKMVARIGICLLIAVCFWCGSLVSDRQRLREDLIRLHVVGNSDSQQDQILKLKVRDAVTSSLQEGLADLGDVQQAKEYLQNNLRYIEEVASLVLREMGCEDSVKATLCLENFETRIYETFTLPAGVYQSLRIVIGNGEGKNWWCVVFPSFCIPAVSEDVETVAQAAGFPEALRGALVGETGYELRFGALDILGRLENILFCG